MSGLLPVLLLLMGAGEGPLMGVAITVYDCTDRGTTVQAIDLTAPAKCADPDVDYKKPRWAGMQLIQTADSTPIHAYQCKLEATREVTICSWWDSRSYGTQVTEWQKNVPLSPDECRRIIKENRLTYEGKDIAITPGVPGGIMWYTHGSLGAGGRCKWGDFWSGGDHYTNAYERLELQWEFGRIHGSVNNHQGEVIFTNGLRTEFATGVVQDAKAGIIAWSTEDTPCSETISEVYVGQGEIYEPAGAGEGELRGAIVMVAEGSQFAGLVLRKAIMVCGVRCYPSQVQNLVVCTGVEAEISAIDFQAGHPTAAINVQTHVSHLHLSSNLKLYRRFEEVQSDICELDRKILHNKLQAIAGALNPYALLDLYGIGHQVIVAGAAAYVGRCVPVEATRAEFGNCTTEVPVSINGTLAFADPLTWIIQEFPTILRCTEVMPVRWKVGLAWYCSFPETRPCPAPPKLNTTTLIYESENFVDGLSRGVYSDAQIEAHARFVTATSTRGPALTKISDSVSGGGATLGGMGLSIPSADMGLLSEKLEGFLFPGIALFGHAWHAFVGFLLIVMVAKIILGCLIRGWVLYRERGLGVWMFSALWHTAFLVVRAPIVIMGKGIEELVEPLEKMPKNQNGFGTAKYYKGVQADVDDELKEQAIHFKFRDDPPRLCDLPPDERNPPPRPLL
jgi:hypothetical protein